MDFSFSPDTLMLKENAARFLKTKCSSSAVKNMLKNEKGFSQDLWKEMANLGWFGLTYEDKYGGTEGSFFDLFILFQEMGKVVLPSPFFCSVIESGFLIREAGDEATKNIWLPSLISGEKIITVGLLDQHGVMDLKKPGIEAREESPSIYFINGTTLLVPYATDADGILILADLKSSKSGGPTLLIVETNGEGQQITPLNTLTGEKLFAVTYKNAPIPVGNILGKAGQGESYFRNVLPLVIILKCGEMLGGMERITDITVEYAKQRYQFGKPIGSLQAIQHYCADLVTFLETARMITYQAAYLISKGITCTKEVAMAKAWCSDAYKKSTWLAMQIHGGIGFTEEHDMHLYYKHAKVSELAFGDSFFHRSIVAKEMGF